MYLRYSSFTTQLLYVTVQPSVLAVITVQQEHTGLMALDVCNVLRVIIVKVQKMLQSSVQKELIMT